MAEGGIRGAKKEGSDDDFFDLKDVEISLNTTAQAPHYKEPDNELRVILVGKVGVGKSSTANTLTNSSMFTVGRSSSSVTKRSHHECVFLKDRKIMVIETPGLFDTGVENTAQHVKDEIKSCIHIGAPGIHAIIFILSAAMRFSREDRQCFEEFCSIFGQDFFEYAVVAFTWADQLLKDNQTLEQYIGDNVVLRSFLKKCGNRMVSINNSNPKPLEKEKQLDHLFDTIMHMNKSNSYKYYTDNLFKEAERKMQKRERKILKQNKKEREEEISKIRLSYEEKYQHDKKRMEKKYLKKMKKIIEKYENQARERAREEVQEEVRNNTRESQMCVLM